VVKNTVFPGGFNLSAQTYNSLVDVQKCITPKLLTISGCACNHWKDEKVLYNYCIGFMVRFSSERFQIRCFWPLVAVKLELTSITKIFILEVVSGFKHGLLHVMSIDFYSPKPKLTIG
jgi:hypothetical protein